MTQNSYFFFYEEERTREITASYTLRLRQVFD